MQAMKSMKMALRVTARRAARSAAWAASRAAFAWAYRATMLAVASMSENRLDRDGSDCLEDAVYG